MTYNPSVFFRRFLPVLCMLCLAALPVQAQQDAPPSQETRFNDLVKVCAGEDMFAKDQAVEEFAGMGASIVQDIIKLLDHANRDVKACAIDTLGKLGGPEAARALEGLVRNLGPGPKYAETFADTYLRNIAIQALGNAKDPGAIPVLKEVVAGKDDGDAAYDRAFALIALVKLGDKESFPALMALVDHTNPDIRNVSVQGLGELGDKAATGVLSKAMEDEKWFVRDSAAKALGQLKDAAALPLLEKTAKEDSSPFVRRSAREALKRTQNE